MAKTLEEADSLDRRDPLFLEVEKRKKIENKMNYLITKGAFEMTKLDELEEKILKYHLSEENLETSSIDTPWPEPRLRHRVSKKPKP